MTMTVTNSGPKKLKSISKDEAQALTETTEAAPQPILEYLSGKAGDVAPPGLSARRLLVRGRGPVPRTTPTDSGLESIIGSVDERQQILDAHEAPWRMVCSLEIHAPNGRFVGTGWFAGPRTIVTAGHCVYDLAQMGGWADKIIVRPGRDGANAPFGSVEATKMSTTETWFHQRSQDFDYGSIHLDAAAGAQFAAVGVFSTAVLANNALLSRRVNISGYPGDKGSIAVGDLQFFHAKQVLDISDRRLHYDVDTMGGQSGAPVWVYEDNSDEPIVVGIHAYGSGGGPTNSGPRINREVFDVIKGWVDADSNSG